MAILEWMSFWDWLFLLMGLGLLLYYWGTSTHRRFIKSGVPHLKPLPFIGDVGTVFLKNSAFHELMPKFYNGLKEHGCGVFFMFRHPIILVCDPELIKAVAVKDFEFFTDRNTTIFENGDPLWTNILVNRKGPAWRDMRSTLSPAFTSSKMKMMFKLVSDCCQQFVNFLDGCYENTPAKDYIIQKDGDMLILELKDFYTRYTNDVIATTAFGLGVDSLRQPKNEFFTMGQQASNFGALRIFLFFLMPRVLQRLGVSLIPGKIADFFRVIVKDTILTREREGIVRPDMIHLLMQAKKGTLQEEDSTEHQKSDKTKFDDEDIVAQAVMFFFAGFDTSSTLMSFLTYLLAVHPDMQARLQKEIDDTLKEGNGKFTYEALNSMKYLDMVVSETLRLYPPISAVDRLCIRNYTLKSDPPIELVPGDNLFLPICGIHRDPKYFPDPERFDPERFSDENKHKINPSTYMPFGVGPRMCIGNRFALLKTKLAVVHLLSRFNLKVTPKTPIPIIMEQSGFNMTVKGGFWLGLEKRPT
ncbi:cytochrome P450 9e2-like [Periplaneta americana]|uniref:cytochrome P450 9e2-like n=1 Tax=Periplaneta americana TaxID=6978 RepID=UPI0037E7C32C